MIAYCGLVCSDCPTFLATRNDDDVVRAKEEAGGILDKYFYGTWTL